MKYLSFRITDKQDRDLSILLNILRHERRRTFVSRQDYMTELLQGAIDQRREEIKKAKELDDRN